MVSFTMLLYFLVLFIVTITEGGKKSMDKIIIHVPYKIHKHHHTHTKYKVITIPAPKKENTVIYLKEEIQPIVQHVQTHTETQPKIPEPFIPPHQESAPALLEDLANHKQESLTQTDQQQQYSTIVDDQKPLESHLGQKAEGLMPSFSYKPIILQQHENFIPNFSFKPVFYPQHTFTPMIHHDFLPNFMLPPNFKPKYTYKPMLPPPKDLQDSVAHTSNQVYKTIITPRPKAVKSYKVKEDILDDHKPRTNLNRIPVPSMKYNRKGKSIHSGYKNTIVPPDSDFEYEHVGYLIIDGNSRKMVGKNFKDEIHLS